MTIRCFNIDYDTSDAELDFAEDCKEALILPDDVEIEIDDDDVEFFKDDLDSYIANEISEKTGWLINSFNYEKIG